MVYDLVQRKVKEMVLELATGLAAKMVTHLVLVLESSLEVQYLYNKYGRQQLAPSFGDYAHNKIMSIPRHQNRLQSCWGFRLFLHQKRLTRPSHHHPEIPRMTAANHQERNI